MGLKEGTSQQSTFERLNAAFEQAHNLLSKEAPDVADPSIGKQFSESGLSPETILTMLLSSSTQIVKTRFDGKQMAAVVLGQYNEYGDHLHIQHVTFAGETRKNGMRAYLYQELTQDQQHAAISMHIPLIDAFRADTLEKGYSNGARALQWFIKCVPHKPLPKNGDRLGIGYLRLTHHLVNRYKELERLGFMLVHHDQYQNSENRSNLLFMRPHIKQPWLTSYYQEAKITKSKINWFADYFAHFSTHPKGRKILGIEVA